jgi:hypothetical protein
MVVSIYAGAAGMLLDINGKFTMGKLKSCRLRQIAFRDSLSFSVYVYVNVLSNPSFIWGVTSFVRL